MKRKVDGGATAGDVPPAQKKKKSSLSAEKTVTVASTSQPIAKTLWTIAERTAASASTSAPSDAKQTLPASKHTSSSPPPIPSAAAAKRRLATMPHSEKPATLVTSVVAHLSPSAASTVSPSAPALLSLLRREHSESVDYLLNSYNQLNPIMAQVTSSFLGIPFPTDAGTRPAFAEAGSLLLLLHRLALFLACHGDVLGLRQLLPVLHVHPLVAPIWPQFINAQVFIRRGAWSATTLWFRISGRTSRSCTWRRAWALCRLSTSCCHSARAPTYARGTTTLFPRPRHYNSRRD